MRMQILRINDNWNRINTREELITLLQGYKGILNNQMINYLNSLIELEFSVVRDYISNSDRTSLAELEVYKRVAMYNIYNRALEIFAKSGIEVEISGNNDGIEGLTVDTRVGKKQTKLFEFNYREGSIPKGYIGRVSIFKAIESVEQREAELERVMNVLDRLYDEKNPYFSNSRSFGGSNLMWAYEHQQKITKYEEKFQLLDTKKELTDEEKREIEITTKINELFIEDYGLSFEDNNKQSDAYVNPETTIMRKILVKKMPSLDIKNHINYI